ncbi:unnamed protein product [Owenia fusiformis]|uniref:PPM-type phosphatase domain-containing protein n=1 Tax=Owenia fusiformis TaxID=6347 RepID=A0A8J1U947_OWEFU|nr:unnamed protein product [Owenia fusiformis]
MNKRLLVLGRQVCRQSGQEPPSLRLLVVSAIHGHKSKGNYSQEISARKLHTFKRKNARALGDPENRGSRQSGVNFDVLGSWNHRINTSLDIEQSIKRGKPIPQIALENVATASMTGRRKSNEDRVQVQKLSPNLLYFAMFDGHGGPEAADYCHEHLHERILYWSEREHDLQNVLKISFIETNNMLSRYLYFRHLAEGTHEITNTGTTATVCLIRNNEELVVGHVGDSPALLCREDHVVRLTDDHSPDVTAEVERIKKHKGLISYNSLGKPTVNGRLAMTRSIGDFEFKPYGVTAEPDTRSLEIKHGKDAFLILTSDGVNFVVSDQEIIDIVINCNSPKEGANLVADQALQFGSDDNVTTLIVPFGAWGKYANSARAVPYSFGRNIMTTRYS